MQTYSDYREFLEMDVNEFLKCKPLSTDPVNETEVNRLRPNIKTIIQEGSSEEFAITCDDRLFIGRHRQEALKREVYDGNISPDYVVPVVRYKMKMSVGQTDTLCWISNHGQQTQSKVEVKVFGQHTHAKRIFTPIAKALTTGDYTNTLTTHKVCIIAQNLGALLNANPALCANLLKGKNVSVRPDEIYAGRNNKLAGDMFWEVGVNINLNPHIAMLTHVLSPVLDVLQFLNTSPAWKRKIGSARLPMAVIYTLISAALSGNLTIRSRKRGMITANNLIKCDTTTLFGLSRKFVTAQPYHHAVKLVQFLSN